MQFKVIKETFKLKLIVSAHYCGMIISSLNFYKNMKYNLDHKYKCKYNEHEPTQSVQLLNDGKMSE